MEKTAAVLPIFSSLKYFHTAITLPFTPVLSQGEVAIPPGF